MQDRNETEVRNLLKRYFEGLYDADSAILRTVFHKDLAYINATPGNYECLGLHDYMQRIEARKPTPHTDRGEGLIDRIILKGDKIGVVEVRMTLMNRNYQDILTLIKSPGGWRVLTKVFQFTMIKD